MPQNSGFAKSCWQMNNKARNPVWMLHGADASFSMTAWVIACIFPVIPNAVSNPAWLHTLKVCFTSRAVGMHRDAAGCSFLRRTTDAHATAPL